MSTRIIKVGRVIGASADKINEYVEGQINNIPEGAVPAKFISKNDVGENVQVPYSAVYNLIKGSLDQIYRTMADSYTREQVDGLVAAGIRDIQPTSPNDEIAGIKFPTQSGTYTNYGGIVVDLSEGLNMIFSDGEAGFTKTVIPIDLAGYATEGFTADAIKGLRDEFLIDSKNVAIEDIEIGQRISITGSLTPRTTNPVNASKPVLLKPSTTYAVSGNVHLYSGSPRAAVFANESSSAGSLVTLTPVAGGWTFTTGDANLFFRIDLQATDDVFSGQLQIEEGNNVTDYEPRAIFFDPQKIKVLPEINQKLISLENITTELEADIDDIVELSSQNLLNESEIDYTLRWSPLAGSVVARGATIYALTDFIPVREGVIYTASGEGVFRRGGAYFSDRDITAVVSPITTYPPLGGSGYSFQVPIGLGVKFIAGNVELTASGSDILITEEAQIEEGEVVTAYKPFLLEKKIREALLPPSSPSSSADGDVYKQLNNISYGDIAKKIPSFRKHWITKDKDLVVINTGTSLTARTTEHSTAHPNAAFRPPLMHSNNFASHIWDRLKWEGQEYRRYDSGFFTETGVWTTSHNVSEWDDGAYRNGLTRYSESNAGTVSFQIPVAAWQFNFIFRTDLVATENALVTISEGNGNVEVWNGSSWVEANGYVFSQRETAITTIASVSYINPITGSTSIVSNYPTKGNTTYQKRLKMRCKSGIIDSRGILKNVTISRSSGRMMYWGVEWSPREFMITYVNAARGSHSITVTSPRALHKFQDNEIWGFQPDLILTENPIHNSNGGNAPGNTLPTDYWGRITEGFFFEENGISLKSRAQTLGITDLEWVIFNSTISWNFGPIEEDGSLKVASNLNGLVLSALDNNMLADLHLKENHEEVVSINAIKNWVEAGIFLFGNMKDATVGSGKIGPTFTNEGSHWNDTGSRIMARVVLPVFDFIV